MMNTKERLRRIRIAVSIFSSITISVLIVNKVYEAKSATATVDIVLLPVYFIITYIVVYYFIFLVQSVFNIKNVYEGTADVAETKTSPALPVSPAAPPLKPEDPKKP